jgi:hypothetical protein
MGLFELHEKDIHKVGSSGESILQQAAVVYVWTIWKSWTIWKLLLVVSCTDCNLSYISLFLEPLSILTKYKTSETPKIRLIIID